MKRLEATVFGRVQGVSFRAFIQKEAQALSLKGFVRNLSNGAVEFVAEGEEKALSELLKKARTGSPLANVDYIDATYAEPSKEFKSFSIKY